MRRLGTRSAAGSTRLGHQRNHFGFSGQFSVLSYFNVTIDFKIKSANHVTGIRYNRENLCYNPWICYSRDLVSTSSSIVGSVVECSPATRAARVRFPDDAVIFKLSILKGLARFDRNCPMLIIWLTWYFLDSSGRCTPGVDPAEEVDDLEADHQRLPPRGRRNVRVQVHRALHPLFYHFYREFHGFRPLLGSRLFWVNFDHFRNKLHILRQLGQYAKINSSLKSLHHRQIYLA